VSEKWKKAEGLSRKKETGKRRGILGDHLRIWRSFFRKKDCIRKKKRDKVKILFRSCILSTGERNGYSYVGQVGGGNRKVY
jgi:hypothetical protein